MKPLLTWEDVAEIVNMGKCEVATDPDERARKRRVTRIMREAGGVDLGRSEWRIQEESLWRWLDSGSGPALPSDNGVVYVIGGEFDAVKVGHSCERTADRRLGALRASNHLDLKILASCPGGYGHEALLHVCLFRDSMHGEWFRRTKTTEFVIAWMNEKRELAGLFRALNPDAIQVAS